ncbi:MAG: hypothetical protein QM586_10125 [Xenophilus sp.]
MRPTESRPATDPQAFFWRTMAGELRQHGEIVASALATALVRRAAA